MDNVDAKPAAVAIDASAWIGRVCFITGLGLACYGIAAYLSGAESVWLAIQRIGGHAIAAGAAATAVSLLIRAIRWQLIFQRLGYRLPRALQLRVYLSGLSLSSSPGKVGETLRSLLLRPYGVAYPESLAAFVCDRLSDVVGIAALGAAMAALAGSREPILEAIALLSLTGSLALSFLLRSEGSHGWRAWQYRWVAKATAPAAVWACLWRGKALASYAGLAAVAYGIQGMIFAGFVGQVHADLSWASCLAIFVNATLIGAASMVPGGLGTMDAALVIQLQNVGVPTGEAVAVSIATRACTLWFAWVIGLSALMTFSKSSGKP